MSYLTTIELHKENMKFSSGHYTIFSAEKRERLHGHNFFIHAYIDAMTDENGIAFDYDIFKDKLYRLCKTLNGYFLLPSHSPYQTIEETTDFIIVHFGEEKIPFPKNDVLFLPIKNVTVEELSVWFIQQLTQDMNEIDRYQIQKILIKVYSGPGQCGTSTWVHPDKLHNIT